MKCFYHSADFDGICSGAIVKKFYPDVDMYPINYGEPFPWDDIGEHERIIMVDFSLQPFSEMLELKEKCGSLVWIDHHQSAIDDFNEHIGITAVRFIHGILRADKAACELTWEYYFPDKPMPRVVKLLGRYDVWDHDYSLNVLPFQYGMRAVHPTYLEPGTVWWEELFKGKFIKERILDGMTILRYEEMSNVKLMDLFSFEGDFFWGNNHFDAVFLNRGGINSKTFKSHYDPMKHELMISFVRIPSGRWTVSLYTTHDHIDCGKICKSFGGGGHPKAGGFQTEELFFL